MSEKNTPEQPQPLEAFDKFESAHASTAVGALSVLNVMHPTVPGDDDSDDTDQLDDDDWDYGSIDEAPAPPSAFVDSYARFEAESSASADRALNSPHLLQLDQELIDLLEEDLPAFAHGQSRSFGFNTFSAEQEKPSSHQNAAPEVMAKQDLNFYNPFRLPEPERHFYNEDEKFRSVVSRVQPLTEPVKVTALSSCHVSIAIGDYTTVLKQESYGSGQVLSISIKELDEFVMVKISGTLMGGRTVDHGITNSDSSVLCFATKELAKQFKHDLLCAYSGVVSKAEDDPDYLLGLSDEEYVSAVQNTRTSTSRWVIARNIGLAAVLVPVGIVVASFAVIYGATLAKSLF